MTGSRPSRQTISPPKSCCSTSIGETPIWSNRYEGRSHPDLTICGSVAWHGCGGDPAVQSRMHDLCGEDEFFTERSGFDGGSRLQAAGYARSGERDPQLGEVLVKWPVAVDEPNGPNRGGCDTCRGLVTVHTNDARGASGLHHRVLVHGPPHQIRSERSLSHRLHCQFTDLERCIPESRWLPRSDCLQ